MQDLFQQIYIENWAVQGIVEKPSMNQMQLLSSKSSQPVGGCTEKQNKNQIQHRQIKWMTHLKQ